MKKLLEEIENLIAALTKKKRLQPIPVKAKQKGKLK